MSNTISVVVFDDNPRVLSSLEALISSYPDLILMGSFLNGDMLEQRIESLKPQVVVMDIDMPGLGGIEATGLIKKKFPDVQILIQTAFDDDRKIFESLCAGASGYILKGDMSENLAEAIYDVCAGGSPMSPSIARKVIMMFKQFGTTSDAKVNQYELTPRELDVLTQLVGGLSYKLIADKLQVSYGTVHTHIKSIYRKLHVASMTEAVSKALKERLV